MAPSADDDGTTPPPTMFAWQYTATTPSIDEHLVLNPSMPTPVPKPAAPSALIRVLATALNPSDYKVPEIPLLGRLMVGAPPATLSRDFAGRVVDAPTAGRGLVPGDLVVGSVWTGALAQYVLEDGVLAKVPDALAATAAADPRRMAQLAGLGVAGVTALRSLARLPAEASVFINGGSGGVGTFAVQIARLLGARRVVSSCSGRNVALMRSLGVDEVVDYTAGDVSSALAGLTKGEGKEKFDLVVDNVGDEDLALYFRADEFLKDQGRYVLVGGPATWAMFRTMLKVFFLPAFLGGGKRKFEFFPFKAEDEDLVKLLGWVAEGKLEIVIDEVFPKEDATAAFRKLRTGRARGKIVVSMAD